jgi:hypothetical protein
MDDLSTLKDDMIAFTAGHGLARFKGFVNEEAQSVLWGNSNPEEWKDFVELANAAGVKFLTMEDVTLEREELDLLVNRLRESMEDDDDVEDARWLRTHVGKVGYIQLGFAYNGTLFLYEISTEWYERYQALVDSADEFGGIIIDEGDDER